MDRPHAPRTRTAALSLMLALGALGSLFTAGETFDDPGGVQAVGLVAAWFVPLVVLSVLAWRCPDALRVPLVGATVALLALDVWFVIDPDAWRSLEDGTGPVRTIATFALAIPVAVYAYHRPRPGGVLLLVLALGPLALGALGPTRSPGGAAMRVLAVPVVLAGVLDLASVDRTRRLAQ